MAAKLTQVEAANKEVRRQVKNAIIAGRTLPYSLRTLVEARVGIDSIRKVMRHK
jgi:hypothetical protein